MTPITTASDGRVTDTNLVDECGAPNSPAISQGCEDGNNDN